MDIVRWIVLGLLFAGLFGLWYWSKRQARINSPPGKAGTTPLRIAQKRWLDKGTGVCLVEAEGQSFLLAYTANGGVSWQPVAKASAPISAEPKLDDLLSLNEFEAILNEAEIQ
jgi:hypothetical protein